MKKIFVIAILGLAGLGFSVEQASAGHILGCLCCKKCCVKLCATQYNAFSPYCLDSMSGCIPLGGFAGNGGGCGPACNYADGGFAMGQLPAPGTVGSPAYVMPGTNPAENMQPLPAMTPGMANPYGFPGNYYPTIMAPTPLPGPGR